MATGKGTESTTSTQKRPDSSPDEGKKPLVMPVGPQLSVRVFKTFPGAEKATPEARCNVRNDAHFKNQSLGHLRKYLNSQKTLKSIIVMQNNDVLHGLRVIPARALDDKLALNGIDRSFLPGTLLESDTNTVPLLCC
jgi:hypothetical protein